MQFRKVFGPARIDSESNGDPKLFELRGRPGGRTTKVVQYMAKIYQSSGTSTEVGVDVEHGPDGQIYGTLKANVIPYTDVSTTPKLIDGAVGAADSNAEVVGEWIQPVLSTASRSTGR